MPKKSRKQSTTNLGNLPSVGATSSEGASASANREESGETIRPRSTSQESHGSQHTDGSGHSSEQEVDSHKAPHILVVSEVALEDSSISFHINTEQRPDTRLEGQGDHITSYTLIIQSLLASANANLRGAITSIKALAQATLAEEELHSFNEIKEPPTHTHEERKIVLRVLNSNSELRSEL